MSHRMLNHMSDRIEKSQTQDTWSLDLEIFPGDLGKSGFWLSSDICSLSGLTNIGLLQLWPMQRRPRVQAQEFIYMKKFKINIDTSQWQ